MPARANPTKPGPQVMAWVPAYGMQASMAAIESNPAIGENLTRLGLQFWNPSRDGRGVVFAPLNQEGKLAEPADVIRFRDWARSRHIKVLLTVYNNSQLLGKWDWALARNAFADQAGLFSEALIREMNQYGLDGIDLDLEGEGDHEADRGAYSQFVAVLSTKLKAQKKIFTIDSFHSPCDNAPNMSWWGDWQGKVDAIHSMGYADLYEGSTEAFTPPGKPICEGGAPLFRYSWQLAYGMRAGYRPEQILLGFPTWLDQWGKGGLGVDAIAHLREVQALGAGVALWDLQLEGKNWRNAATWNAVSALRKNPGAGWKNLSKK